jgi:hypothetical protein
MKEIDWIAKHIGRPQHLQFPLIYCQNTLFPANASEEYYASRGRRGCEKALNIMLVCHLHFVNHVSHAAEISQVLCPHENQDVSRQQVILLRTILL